MEADGIVGPLTSAALTKAVEKSKKVSADSTVRSGAIAVAATSIGHEMINQLTPIQSMPIKALQIAASIGIFIAIGLVAYGMYRRAVLATGEVS